MHAAQLGQTTAVGYLLAHGARVNDRDKHGYTALMWTAVDGWTATAQALLAANADTTIKGKDGFTAHAIAVKRGQASVADLLPATP